jgi:hypothetical protein
VHVIQQPPKYWGIPQPDLMVQLNTKTEGLSGAEARERGLIIVLYILAAKPAKKYSIKM